MVVHDLNVFGARSRPPAETNTKLFIDADAVLPGTFTLKRLQAVPGWHLEILEPTGDLQLA